MRGEGRGRERTGSREEGGGRAIVQGAAAAARGREGARGGRGSGARTEEPAEERGEGGLRGEGRKGEGGDGGWGLRRLPGEEERERMELRGRKEGGCGRLPPLAGVDPSPHVPGLRSAAPAPGRRPLQPSLPASWTRT